MTDEAFPEVVDRTDLSLERSMLAQRFPTPWRVEADSESFVIRDAASKPLGYVYFAKSHQPTRNLLTRDEAWSMATNIATLQNLTTGSG